MIDANDNLASRSTEHSFDVYLGSRNCFGGGVSFEAYVVDDAGPVISTSAFSYKWMIDGKEAGSGPRLSCTDEGSDISVTVTRTETGEDVIREASVSLVGTSTKSASRGVSTRGTMLYGYAKTSCSSLCPAYRVEVYEDGTVLYTGISNVKQLGTVEKKATPAMMASLSKAVEDNDYFDLNTSYPDTVVIDKPATITYVNAGDENREVVDYADAPVNLSTFEGTLEKVIQDLGLSAKPAAATKSKAGQKGKSTN